jgi:hypothetical protein
MPNVTVTQPAVIKVQVGNKPAAVQTISYGSKTLRSSSDLSIPPNANTGDVIIYNSANNNFSVTSISAEIGIIDGGLF